MAEAPKMGAPAGDDRRRAMIAKINIARQQLGMAEEDYRAVLFDVTGTSSLRDCDERQLLAMLERLKARGFVAKPSTRAADHPMARKARAMWISLHQLGVIDNPSEEALEAFARRQLGCERLSWARQSEANRLIEALKSMGKRAGWIQFDWVSGKPLDALGLQLSLCQAILLRAKAAGAVPEDWWTVDAARILCGLRPPFSSEDYTRLAEALAQKLRAAKGAEA